MDYGLADDRSATGYYTGFLCGSLMLGRAVGAPFWGWVADQWGRKPVLLISLLSIAIGSLGLGLARNLETAVLSLLLAGVFCNLSATAKTCVSEVASGAKQTRAMAFYALGWFYGQIAGYLIGGFLVHPELSGLVTKGIVVTYPYLLPNLICAAVSLLTFVGILVFFKETLAAPPATLSVPHDSSYLRSNKGLIAFYLLSVFCNTGFIETFPLWCWSSQEHGGLDLSTAEIGVTLTAAYVVLGLGQSWVYGWFARRLGLRKVVVGSSMLLCPVLVSISCLNLLPRLWLQPVLAFACLLFYLLSYNVFTSLFVLINRSVSQQDRAKLNSCSMGVGYVVKGLTPLIVDFSFAYTSESGHRYPFDHHFVFTLLGLGTAVAAVLAAGLKWMEEEAKESYRDMEESRGSGELEISEVKFAGSN